MRPWFMQAKWPSPCSRLLSFCFGVPPPSITLGSMLCWSVFSPSPSFSGRYLLTRYVCPAVSRCGLASQHLLGQVPAPRWSSSPSSFPCNPTPPPPPPPSPPFPSQVPLLPRNFLPPWPYSSEMVASYKEVDSQNPYHLSLGQGIFPPWCPWKHGEGEYSWPGRGVRDPAFWLDRLSRFPFFPFLPCGCVTRFCVRKWSFTDLFLFFIILLITLLPPGGGVPILVHLPLWCGLRAIIGSGLFGPRCELWFCV